jgi:hypothetical protein
MFTAADLEAGLRMSRAHATKTLQRLEAKGRLKRVVHGQYELTEKPLSSFMPEAVQMRDTVHRALVEGSMPVFRVNGLQGFVRLGEVGVAFFRRLEREVR